MNGLIIDVIITSLLTDIIIIVRRTRSSIGIQYKTGTQTIQVGDQRSGRDEIDRLERSHETNTTNADTVERKRNINIASDVSCEEQCSG